MRKIFGSLLLTLISIPVFSQTTVTFTSDGNFIVPVGVTSVTIQVVGAGGAGGGNGGGGGGGGGYATGTFTVTPGQSMNVVVDAAGSEGSTHVDNLITAYAGANGFSVPNPTIGGGGAGGTAVGGTINHTGGNGGGGYWTYFGGGGGGAAGITSNGFNGGNTIAWTGMCITPGGSAGGNGGAPGGDGGKGAGFTDAGCNVTDPAGNGLNYGGGGGGGNGNGGGPGTGMPGYVTITYNSCSVNAATTTIGTTISADQAGISYQWINCSDSSIISGETNQSFTPALTGNYAVILNDAGCIDTSLCVNVIVCSLTATATVQDDTLHAIETGTYQWINCADSTTIVGAVAQQFVPTANGSYAVIITDGLCSDTSSCITIAGLGHEENTLAILNIYPNPFHHTIQVLNTTGNETYVLMNAVGQVIWKGIHIETKDFSTLINGIYFLRIMNDTHTREVKLIRQ